MGRNQGSLRTPCIARAIFKRSDDCSACVFYVSMASRTFDGINVTKPCGQAHIFMHENFLEEEFCSYCLDTLLVNVSGPLYWI